MKGKQSQNEPITIVSKILLWSPPRDEHEDMKARDVRRVTENQIKMSSGGLMSACDVSSYHGDSRHMLATLTKGGAHARMQRERARVSERERETVRVLGQVKKNLSGEIRVNILFVSDFYNSIPSVGFPQIQSKSSKFIYCQCSAFTILSWHLGLFPLSTEKQPLVFHYEVVLKACPLQVDTDGLFLVCTGLRRSRCVVRVLVFCPFHRPAFFRGDAGSQSIQDFVLGRKRIPLRFC